MIGTIGVAALLTLTMAALPAAAGEPEEPVAARADHIFWGDYRPGAATLVWRDPPSRPGVLTALYASYGALQAYDVYSTRQALARGARESNPLMQGVVGHPAAFMALKAGVGIATIMAAERLWRTNKAAAIAVMAASTSVAAIVAARNARTLRQLP